MKENLKAVEIPLEQFVIRRFSEKYCYLVEEDEKYLWGDVEEAVKFTKEEAKHIQATLAFKTKLEKL